MMNQFSFIRRAARQVFVLIALIGLTFAAGIEWAEAATNEADHAVAGAAHVVLLFLATIGIVVHMLNRPQQRVSARARTRRRVR